MQLRQVGRKQKIFLLTGKFNVLKYEDKAGYIIFCALNQVPEYEGIKLIFFTLENSLIIKRILS